MVKKNQLNIRKCIGEAVPTNIFRQIAKKIKKLNEKNIYDSIKDYEINNPNRDNQAAYFTNRSHISYAFDMLPDFKKDEINILEPSVGGGSFLPLIFSKYDSYKKVNLYLNDISKESLEFCKKIINEIIPPKNFNIVFSQSDFLNFDNGIHFDLIIGNPPFKKDDNNLNNNQNLFELFWKKAFVISNNVIFINPKFMIQSPSYKNIRETLKNHNVNYILDFGELGFKDAKIETILVSTTNKKIKNVIVKSIPKKIRLCQKPEYIFNHEIGYWIIYRNEIFDNVYEKLKKDIFDINKNYEVSNKLLLKEKTKNSVWVLKSKNISTTSPEFVHIKNYDRYIDKKEILNTKFYKFLTENKKELFLIPTLTYYPRVLRMPNDVFVNGSILVATLKDKKIKITDDDIYYFYSEEFRNYYSIAFNHSTRTLNIDKNTIKLFGVRRK